nr:uncharacterized protein LOC127332530 [Lolium perenne]
MSLLTNFVSYMTISDGLHRVGGPQRPLPGALQHEPADTESTLPAAQSLRAGGPQRPLPGALQHEPADTSSGCALSGCDLAASSGCAFVASPGRAFAASSGRAFAASSGCAFVISSGCALSGCDFVASSGCAFVASSGCAFAASSGCAFAPLPAAPSSHKLGDPAVNDPKSGKAEPENPLRVERAAALLADREHLIECSMNAR